MVKTQLAYLVLLGLVALERGFELRLSRRNAALAFEQGGIEVGQGHFGVMRALHAAFFLACALEVVVLGRSFDPRLGYPMLALAFAAQALRYWAITSRFFADSSGGRSARVCTMSRGRSVCAGSTSPLIA